MFDERYYSLLAQQLADTHSSVAWNRIYYCTEVDTTSTGFFSYFSTDENIAYQWNHLYLDFGIEKNFCKNEMRKTVEIVRSFNDAYVDNHQERWTILTFILNSDGSFHADFSYEDLDELSGYERRQLWEEKYLPKDHTLIL